jgi:endonuclease/exonuclease/phosphatase family metal-dependent hydrolase
MSASLNQSASHDRIELKVMTFNVKVGSSEDGPDHWKFRKDIFLDCLRNYPADIIGTQEGLPFQLQAIKETFPHFDFIGIGRYHNVEVDRENERGEGEHCAIFYDREQFDVLRHGTFWLSDTPEIAGSITWGNSLARIVTWAIFKHKEQGTTFSCFNTHFHWGEECQRKSAQLLIKKLGEFAAHLPVIVMGDFNAVPESEPWKILTTPQHDSEPGNQLWDCWSVLGKPESGTSHSFNGIPQKRIDWIFVSRHWNAKSIDKIEFNRAGRYPSDHFPIMAVVELGNEI